jgi:hypothetical protein
MGIACLAEPIALHANHFDHLRRRAISSARLWLSALARGRDSGRPRSAMEQRDRDPGAMLADKGYDSDSACHDLKDRGTALEISTKSNRKVQHSVSKRL